MFCEKCGQEIKEGAKFCLKCGNPIQIVKVAEEEKKKLSKKNKKTGKKIIRIILIAIIFGGTMAWLQSPNRIYYHLSHGNSDKANEIYEKRYSDFTDDEGKLRELIEKGIDENYQLYFAEEIDAEQALEYLDKIEELNEEESDILVKTKKQEIQKLIDSRRAYTWGAENIEEEEYKAAIVNFGAVMESDSYYEKANEGKRIAEDRLKAQVINNINTYRKNEEYDKAVEELQQVEVFLVDDTELKELEKRCEQEAYLYNIVCEFEDENYHALCERNNETETNIINQMQEDIFYFIPGEKGEAKTGKGLGIYKVEGGYWFYYGDLVNGIREGNGKWFAEVAEDDDNEKYWLYDGEWKDDYPNGKGSYRDIWGTESIVIVEGNFVDGKVDGKILLTQIGEDEEFHGEFNAENGIPEKIIDREAAEEKGFTIGEDRYIFAFANEKYEDGTPKRCWHIDNSAIFVDWVSK